MILKIAIAVGGLIAAILIFAATKPHTFYIQRSATIKAPREKIFALIDDFHNWSKWAPQDREDPTVKRTYCGPSSGQGAVSEWNGSGSAGRGRMVIAESLPLQRISIKVDFVKPFESHTVNEFTLEPAGSSTTIRWSMQCKNLYMMKIMSVFINMDRMMGKHFETGLRNLQSVAEQ